MKLTPMRAALTFVLVLALAAFASPAMAGSPNIEGVYDAKGANPGGGGAYAGTVKISKVRGNLYRISWSVGASYEGTAILVDNVLSVAYVDSARTWFGVVAYKVLNGGKKLAGEWTEHTGKRLGTETLTKR